MPSIECLTLRLEIQQKPGLKGPLYKWLVANGMSMGKWTLNFGIHCYADSNDCKEFVQTIHEQTPGSEIIPIWIPLPANAHFQS